MITGSDSPKEGKEMTEAKRGSAAELQSAANELLRELNAKVFGDHIDIVKLPEAVGMCEDFAKDYALSVQPRCDRWAEGWQRGVEDVADLCSDWDMPDRLILQIQRLKLPSPAHGPNPEKGTR